MLTGQLLCKGIIEESIPMQALCSFSDPNLLKVPHNSKSQQWRSAHLAVKVRPIASNSDDVIQCIVASCIL